MLTLQQAKRILVLHNNFKALDLPQNRLIEEAIKTHKYFKDLANSMERFYNSCVGGV